MQLAQRLDDPEQQLEIAAAGPADSLSGACHPAGGRLGVAPGGPGGRGGHAADAARAAAP